MSLNVNELKIQFDASREKLMEATISVRDYMGLLTKYDPEDRISREVLRHEPISMPSFAGKQQTRSQRKKGRRQLHNKRKVLGLTPQAYTSNPFIGAWHELIHIMSADVHYHVKSKNQSDSSVTKKLDGKLQSSRWENFAEMVARRFFEDLTELGLDPFKMAIRPSILTQYYKFRVSPSKTVAKSWKLWSIGDVKNFLVKELGVKNYEACLQTGTATGQPSVPETKKVFVPEASDLLFMNPNPPTPRPASPLPPSSDDVKAEKSNVPLGYTTVNNAGYTQFHLYDWKDPSCDSPFEDDLEYGPMIRPLSDPSCDSPSEDESEGGSQASDNSW